MSSNPENVFSIGDLVCDCREDIPRNVYRIISFEGPGYVQLEAAITHMFRFQFRLKPTSRLQLAEPEELL